jgi:hypothetical protein
MVSNTSELTQSNTEKCLTLASALFPLEEWIPHGAGIFVAKSRLTGGHKEQAKFYREIADVRILTMRGSVAYFLPERYIYTKPEGDEEPHEMYADTVINGIIVEIKTVSGNRATLGKSFRRGYKQGRSLLRKHGITVKHSVFLRVLPLSALIVFGLKLPSKLKTRPLRDRIVAEEATMPPPQVAF